jgi:hypothetical protein
MVGANSIYARPTQPQSQATLARIMAAIASQRASNYGIQLEQNHGNITANFGKLEPLNIGVSSGRD